MNLMTFRHILHNMHTLYYSLSIQKWEALDNKITFIIIIRFLYNYYNNCVFCQFSLRNYNWCNVIRYCILLMSILQYNIINNNYEDDKMEVTNFQCCCGCCCCNGERDSLPITLIRAPFSSFSLWFSDDISWKHWKGNKRSYQYVLRVKIT